MRSDCFTTNGLNQIATKNGSAFAYDARGNLTSDGVSSYAYNAENMLISATQAGATASLTYDAENRLQSITKSGVTTKFVYDGNDLIAEYNGSNQLLRKYVHGEGIDEPVVWYEGTGTVNKKFLYSDNLGSIIVTADGSGNAVNISTYDAYGNRTNSNPSAASRFGYTGQVDLSELGLLYYKARMYDPKIGRFLQTDPIGYGDGMNWYAYVGGDPINGTDPTGLRGRVDIGNCTISYFNYGGSVNGGPDSFRGMHITNVSCNNFSKDDFNDGVKRGLGNISIAYTNWATPSDSGQCSKNIAGYGTAGAGIGGVIGGLGGGAGGAVLTVSTYGTMAWSIPGFSGAGALSGGETGAVLGSGGAYLLSSACHNGGNVHYNQASGGDKGKIFRGGNKKDRDKWYGYNNKNFQRWWHRVGKGEFGGNDIDNASEAKEIYDYWVSIVPQL